MKKLIEYEIGEELQEDILKVLLTDDLDLALTRPILLKGISFHMIDADGNEFDYKLSKKEAVTK